MSIHHEVANLEVKCAVREALSEQGWLVAMIISDTVPVVNKESFPVLDESLAQNINKIYSLLKGIVGYDNARDVQVAFQRHIDFALTMFEYAADDLLSTDSGSRSIDDFLQQGSDVAEALSFLNPKVLPLSAVKKAIREHNDYIVAMVGARSAGDYKRHSNILKKYNEQFLGVADLLSKALTDPSHAF
jgi:hypothetical protein